MRVRSFELTQKRDDDLRSLHDYLLEVGGFEFRAGGAGFFVLVSERFSAQTGATGALIVMAAREADTISVDCVVAGGNKAGATQLPPIQRATDLLRGFAERNELNIIDI